MASVTMGPPTVLKNADGGSILVERLPDVMNDMKIRDDKVLPHHQFGFDYSCIFSSHFLFSFLWPVHEYVGAKSSI